MKSPQLSNGNRRGAQSVAKAAATKVTSSSGIPASIIMDY